ncbi:MAG: hydrolase [Phycisphaerales bacterium]|nr:hydrolase [Phycisphaerales bacterium]
MTPPAPILRFHAIGQWSPDQLAVEQTPSTQRSTPEVDQAIERAWQHATARPGVQLFDGPMCRLESWHATPDRLKLTLSRTTYKTFLGTNLTHPELADRFGPQILANPVGVSPALLTADNFLMMGRRNASVAYYPNRIHPFAGALDPDDANPFTAVRRELREELGFADDDVAEIHLTGIAEDLAIRQPELIFLARSNRTRHQVEAALDRTEHHATWSTPATPEAIEAALRSGESFTPVATASILLYARLAFGEPFFARHAALFTGPDRAR